jgi:hypothetical protein
VEPQASGGKELTVGEWLVDFFSFAPPAAFFFCFCSSFFLAMNG